MTGNKEEYRDCLVNAMEDYDPEYTNGEHV